MGTSSVSGFHGLLMYFSTGICSKPVSSETRGPHEYLSNAGPDTASPPAANQIADDGSFMAKFLAMQTNGVQDRGIYVLFGVVRFFGMSFLCQPLVSPPLFLLSRPRHTVDWHPGGVVINKL